MSTYDDASLIYYPSGYKAGTAYSLKPTDGSGDLTFTRASTATRVNADGLIEKVRTNLILQSNQFDTAPWDLGAITETSGQSGYDGSSNAWLITKDANAYRAIEQPVTITGIYTFSIYAKTNTATNTHLRDLANGVGATFDLTTGTISAITALSASMDSVGGGWYRCSITVDTSTTIVGVYIDFAIATASSIFIQDTQAETGDIATEYIPTTTTAVSVGMIAGVPRIDYTGGGCGKLLLEPQRTNIKTYSEDFSATAGWSASIIGGSTAVFTANYGISPDGTQNADRLQLSLNGGSYSDWISYNAVSIATTYTYSVYVKSLSGTKTLEFLGGTPTGNILKTITTEWTRITHTFTATSGDLYPRFLIQSGGTTAISVDILVYGAQLEASSYPTSYIPTLASSVTRLADAASKSGISSLINSTEGVLYAEIAALADDLTNRLLSLSDGTSTNRIFLGFNSLSNSIRFRVQVNNVYQAEDNFIVADTTQYLKIGFKFKENDFALWINGVEVLVDNSGSTFSSNTLNTLSFDSGAGGSDFFGKCQSLMVFPTVLSDDDLTLLTGTLGETYFESYALMANYLNYTIQ